MKRPKTYSDDLSGPGYRRSGVVASPPRERGGQRFGDAFYRNVRQADVPCACLYARRNPVEEATEPSPPLRQFDGRALDADGGGWCALEGRWRVSTSRRPLMRRDAASRRRQLMRIAVRSVSGVLLWLSRPITCAQ